MKRLKRPENLPASAGKSVKADQFTCPTRLMCFRSWFDNLFVMVVDFFRVMVGS